MIRSIDSQYRIRQIDPDVATMTVIPDEKEGVKRLRILYACVIISLAWWSFEIHAAKNIWKKTIGKTFTV